MGKYLKMYARVHIRTAADKGIPILSRFTQAAPPSHLLLYKCTINILIANTASVFVCIQRHTYNAKFTLFFFFAYSCSI